MDWVAKNIPCQDACPAKTRVPEYLGAISEGDNNLAYRINLVDNVFPAVLGRVCARPCEPVCRHGREGLGQPVAICHSKRTSADFCNQAPVVLDKLFPETGKRIAIVGSGPAGLTVARNLALYGHRPTVYEMYSEPGGMMNQGIPGFRLPRNLIQKEIDQIRALGVTIICNTQVGKDITIEELADKNHAVILAAGTLNPNIIDIPGKDLKGIRHGLDFLLEANQTGKAKIGKRVIVIGGGFTAMDCVRSALRLGSDAAIYYRRSREEMSVNPEEVEEVENEGIPLELMVSPVAYIDDGNGRVKAARFIRNELGEPDASGRRRPVPVEGSEFDVAVDTVLLATGQSRDISWLDPGYAAVLFNQQGRINSGEAASADLDHIFFAGDFALGATTLIDAIGHAKQCAISVDAWLIGDERMVQVVEIDNAFDTGRIPEMDEIKRQKMPTLSLKKRDLTAEVETGFKLQPAATESQRCYLCHYKFEIDNDLCIYCEKCLEVKPQESCIVRIDALKYDSDGRITDYKDASDPTPEKYALLYIDQDECTRCGRCEKVCPVECISIQKVSRISVPACMIGNKKV